MRKAVGGYEGVRKVWIYFISCFLALWQLFVVYQPWGCASAAAFQGVRSCVHTPGSMDSPGMEGPCCTKDVRVLSMLQRCHRSAEALKNPSKTWMSRDGMLEDLSVMFLVVTAALLSILLGGLQG